MGCQVGISPHHAMIVLNQKKHARSGGGQFTRVRSGKIEQVLNSKSQMLKLCNPVLMGVFLLVRTNYGHIRSFIYKYYHYHFIIIVIMLWLCCRTINCKSGYSSCIVVVVVAIHIYHPSIINMST